MIFQFSGTGNSLWVSKMLSVRLADTQLVDMAKALADGKSLQFDAIDSQTIGFVFPVHSWGIPWLVCRFIKKMQLVNASHCKVFCVITCGDDCGYTNKQVRKLLAKKGLDCKHIYSVQMPNTYIVFPGFDVDSADVEQKKLSSAPQTIDRIVDAIKTDNTIDCYLQTTKPFLKSRIIYPMFCKFAMSDKPFYSTDACTSCALCVKNCPTRNITLVNGRPKWGGNCTQCLGCMHKCPARAIEYGDKTQTKGRYFCKAKVE